MFDLLIDQALSDREKQGLLRQRVAVTILDSTHLEHAGRRYVNFASNNYLGLTHHPRILAALAQSPQTHGSGSAAAPLITGYTIDHQLAEQAIAKWKGFESALLLPSGYQANLGAVQAIAGVCQASEKRARFLIDKLSHASLIDAVHATQAPYRIFPHNNLAKLARLLSDADADETQVVLTESIFSMDGDAADLAGLAQLKRDHPFLLLLDEAHATGVYGPAGAGYAAELSLSNIVDLSIVTLSKAIGLAGGAVCASDKLISAVQNFGRAYIYSTSIPTSIAAGAIAAIQIIHEEPHRQIRVRALAKRVRKELQSAGLTVPGLPDSPILPILLGEESAALAATNRLRDQGLWVVPVRPPTVPRRTSRLRITLCADHTDGEIDRLIRAVSK